MDDIVGRDVAGLGGRPLGARQTFSAAFARDLAATWGEHGKAAYPVVAEISPVGL